jgi:predicted HTH domain antitoxin
MATVTLSVRIDKREAGDLERLAKELGLERSACLKQLIRRGFADVQFERACDLYQRREVTLSRAAEIAGLGLRDMVLRMSRTGMELNYDTKALARDLEE